MPLPHRRARARRAGVGDARRGGRAGQGAPDGRLARPASAVRPAGRRQGPDRHGGLADLLRFADPPGPSSGEGRGVRAQVARRGRDRPRQDRHHGVRGVLAGEDAQPPRSIAHAGRILQRFGGRSGRRNGACSARVADRRLRRTPRRVLRSDRVQADLRRRAARRRPSAGARAGYARVLRARDRGRPPALVGAVGCAGRADQERQAQVGPLPHGGVASGCAGDPQGDRRGGFAAGRSRDRARPSLRWLDRRADRDHGSSPRSCATGPR